MVVGVDGLLLLGVDGVDGVGATLLLVDGVVLLLGAFVLPPLFDGVEVPALADVFDPPFVASLLAAEELLCAVDVTFCTFACTLAVCSLVRVFSSLTALPDASSTETSSFTSSEMLRAVIVAFSPALKPVSQVTSPS